MQATVGVWENVHEIKLPKWILERFNLSNLDIVEITADESDALVIKKMQRSKEELERIRQAREALFGCMKGEVWIAEDFDAPLDEMREYME